MYVSRSVPHIWAESNIKPWTKGFPASWNFSINRQNGGKLENWRSPLHCKNFPFPKDPDPSKAWLFLRTQPLLSLGLNKLKHFRFIFWSFYFFRWKKHTPKSPFNPGTLKKRIFAVSGCFVVFWEESLTTPLMSLVFFFGEKEEDLVGGFNPFEKY